MSAHRKQTLIRRLLILSFFAGEFSWAFASIALGIPLVVYGLTSIAGVFIPSVLSGNA